MVSIVGIKGSVKTVRALDKGVARHNDSLVIVDDIQSETVKNADTYIQTNLIKPKIANSPSRREAYQYILDSKKPFLVIESPVFRQYEHLKYTRLGWWSYKWTDGNFNNTNSPSDRWLKFQKESGITIKDWNSPGDSILIMGQKEGDSSLNLLYERYKSFYDWVEFIVNEIRLYSDRPIIIRPHPRNLSHGRNLANKLSKKLKNITVSKNVQNIPDSEAKLLGVYDNEEGLKNDFSQAHCVVTYNSLSGVEAVCEGIPTFALDDGSMVWPVTHRKLDQIENLDYNIDRTQWCNDVAYTHWTAKENRKGESWEHLKPVFFNND